MQEDSNIDLDDPMQSPCIRSLEEERLLSLIEFAQQSARLKLNPTKDVGRHGIFHLFEHDLISLPGIHLNPNEDEDELWLRIERLSETQPPEPKDPLLTI